MSALTQVLIYLLAVVIVVALAMKFGGMSQQQGYRFGRDVIVRCRAGHVFMTTWIPVVSFKAIRFGLTRLQYCPVGDHVTAVRLMRDEDLTAAERLAAGRHRDGGVP